MIIKTLTINNSRRGFDITTSNRASYSLPFSKLQLVPTPHNKIKEAYVDKELGKQGITYFLESGAEDSVPLDAFLDYNKDPNYMRKIALYKLTARALDQIEKSKLSKREIARKLHTSPAQLYRLLDTTNYRKTIDQMVKLLAALGCSIEITAREEKSRIKKAVGF